MKRTSFNGARAALSLAAGLLLSGVAMPAAAVNCSSGEPKAVIKGDPVQSAADFFQNASGVWTLTTVQVDSQDGTNGSKPNNGDYAWSVLSGPTVTLVPFANDKVKFLAPDVDSSGASLVLQLAVSCTRGGVTETAKDTVTINITDAYSGNRAPIALASADPANASDHATVTLIGSGSDPDGNPISFLWTQTDGPAVTLANPTAAITTFVAPNTSDSNGATLKFRLRVSDGNLSSTSDVTVNVVWVNDPPAARLACPLDLLDLSEGQAFVLDGSASSDTEAGALTYAWSGGPWTTLTTPWDGTPTLSLGDITGNVANLIAPLLTQGQVGKFTYRLTVTDAGGLYTFKECDVFVHDTTKPVISVPEDIIAEATSPIGAIIGPDRGYIVSAFDNVDGSLPYGPDYFTCAPPPGSWFELDKATPVACIARDSAGNEATAGFSVSVVDTTAPVIDAPESIGVEAEGPGGTAVNFSVKSHDLVDGEQDASCVPASGFLFPINAPGPVTIVTCNATDAHGNPAPEVKFEVAVHDTTPPAFDPLTVVDVVAEATSPAGAQVTFDLPKANDIVDLGNVAVTCAPPSGSTFALGDTTVSCDAVDSRGNNTVEDGLTASFKVTVQDTTPPMLVLPSDIVEEATGPLGAPVTFSVSASDLVDANVEVNCSANPGDTFAIATTAVNCIATDDAGNSAAGSFNVTVQDTQGPVISDHAWVYAYATANSTAVVNYELPTAIDVVDGPSPVSCVPASGSLFNVGPTTVYCTSQDTRGNTSHSSFVVTVTFNFTGFFQPVDNAPAVNSVKAGSSVPLKFSLGGNQGLEIFSSTPASGQMTCGATDGAAIEETAVAGSSGLQYDATANQYIYVWKTEKSWAGQCRILQVKLKDGGVKSAYFKFK